MQKSNATIAAGQGYAMTGDPKSGKMATSDPGPRDPAVAELNKFAFAPPRTDHGNLGTLKYSFSEARNRQTNAGWAREVTVRNFPIAKAMAGVNMRLEAGSVRELHWHIPSEWAYMTYGRARITGVDPLNRRFIADVKEGDLWFFPSGVPHSIQALGPDGCEFILVFNDGNFSEDSTFLLTDWLEHTPRDVLAKNLGVDEGALKDMPPRELYIFHAPMPGTLEADLAQSSQPEVPNPYSFALMDVKPIETRGGRVRIADVHNFKASDTTCAALVEVEPGGMREMHWHPTSDEWQYWISGKGRMTIFASEGRANTVEFSPSDVGYVPRSMAHYIENIGQDTLRFLEVFSVGEYADVSLNSWLANVPAELVAAHLNMDPEIFRRLDKKKTPVLPA
jgi:oxalate decarboxylase